MLGSMEKQVVRAAQQYTRLHGMSFGATLQYAGDAPESIFSAMLVSREWRSLYTAWRAIRPKPHARGEMPKGSLEKYRNINLEGVVAGCTPRCECHGVYLRMSQ